MQQSPALQCTSLSKTYGVVRALKSVSIEVADGEVRALLGKNGAGKSTLVKLLSGLEQPDKGGGEIRLGGTEVKWQNSNEAQRGGIAVVHQEFSLVPELSIAENITLGRWPRKSGVIDKKLMVQQARTAMALLGVDLPPKRAVSRLSTAQQQLVEISKALLDQPKVLILDEPTSALNTNEVDTLLALLRRLASQGVSIIYVSHRMREIPAVADTLTVLRDGEEVATCKVSEVSTAQVAAMIAGPSDKEDRVSSPMADRAVSNDVAMTVKGLRLTGILEDVTFELRRGEVLGIAGLLGSGRTELLQSIFGIRRDSKGVVKIGNKTMRNRTPQRMLRSGVAYTPEDRKSSGIVPILSLGENLMLTARSRVIKGPLIQKAKERVAVAKLIKSLRIAASSGEQTISTLSGGNQQKGVIGRCLAGEMQVLLLDEPTRGVDVHAKVQIYGLIRDLADAGVSSIFVSSELEEMPQVCDRVLVLRDGRIQEEVAGVDAVSERLLALAMKGEEGTSE